MTFVCWRDFNKFLAIRCSVTSTLFSLCELNGLSYRWRGFCFLHPNIHHSSLEDEEFTYSFNSSPFSSAIPIPHHFLFNHTTIFFCGKLPYSLTETNQLLLYYVHDFTLRAQKTLYIRHLYPSIDFMPSLRIHMSLCAVQMLSNMPRKYYRDTTQ